MEDGGSGGGHGGDDAQVVCWGAQVSGGQNVQRVERGKLDASARAKAHRQQLSSVSAMITMQLLSRSVENRVQPQPDQG